MGLGARWRWAVALLTTQLLCCGAPAATTQIESFDLECFGWIAQSILESPLAAQTPRDLNVFEFFDGVGTCWRGARECGLAGQGFDKIRGQDVTNVAGSLAAVVLVLRSRIAQRRTDSLATLGELV